MGYFQNPSGIGQDFFFYKYRIIRLNFILNVLSLFYQKSNPKLYPMKKLLLFIAAMMLFLAEGFSQASFNTGALEVRINQYGKIIITAPNGLDQMWRTSILVGSSPTAVFDYQNDAEEYEPTVLVPDPAISDFEIYGAYDNSYSGDPPDVIVRLSAYGWTNGGYIIVKFNIENSGTLTINALAGLDIIPFIDEEDGYDSVSYNSAARVIRIHRGNQTNTGIKLLSASLSSLYSFEYYEDYYVDSDYWTWMNYGSIQPQYPSNSSAGSVSITSQNAVSLAPGASFNVFYAFALGTNEQTMLSNIAAAEQKYYIITSVDDKETFANELNLDQNHPNPFNNATTITYQLPDNGFANLQVFDLIGNRVATLVDSKQTRGSHTIDFSAADLSSGIYYYTLRFNDQVRSGKMIINK